MLEIGWNGPGRSPGSWTMLNTLGWPFNLTTNLLVPAQGMRGRKEGRRSTIGPRGKNWRSPPRVRGTTSPYGLTPGQTVAQARSHKLRGTVASVPPIGSHRVVPDLPPDPTIPPIQSEDCQKTRRGWPWRCPVQWPWWEQWRGPRDGERRWGGRRSFGD